ncbi:anti-sigma factor antagonist [Lachnospiraceae bacterium C1.1]|nr:anti-sigma factor antagonist [Lachnospiraceae bacterium C1.1]
MDIDIRKETENREMTISLSGRLDALSLRELEKKFEEAISENEGISEVFINMEDLEYISSAGLRFLLSNYKRMTAAGGNLTVVRPSEPVMEVLSMTGFDNLIPIEYERTDIPLKEDHNLYPLRPNQRMMMDLHFIKASSTMMNMRTLLRLDPSLNLELFRDAINAAVQDHDIFRCHFVIDTETGDIKQRFDGKFAEIEIEDLTEEELNKTLRNLSQPYKISECPLWHFRLLRSGTEQYFYYDCYHAIMDGVSSVALFYRQIDRYYKELSKGKTVSELRRIRSSYAGLIRSEMASGNDNTDEAKKYWEEKLAGYTDEGYTLPADLDEKSGEEEAEYPLDMIRKDFFHTVPYHENEFFMGAAMLALSIAIGRKDIIMTYVHSGRTSAKEFGIMGLMLEDMVMCFDFNKDMSVNDYIAEIETTAKEDLKNRKGLETVYERMAGLECPEFIFQKGAIGRRGELTYGDTKAVMVPLPEDENNVNDSTVKIELNAHDDGSYSVVICYDPGSYSKPAIDDFAKTFRNVIIKMQQGKSVFEIIKEGK